MKLFLLFAALLPGLAFGADLKPDAGTEIPESAKRPVVVTSKTLNQALPTATLPPGYALELAAAAPLVLHPIMGCLDDRGRLFVGDATGVNWNKKQLEANPPNRVLMLEDTDHNGVFDKSTVFADKMTFPQGACWLKDSLYVCSPPGLWKLTDTDGDGVADQRDMIVTGFEYTGNAADVHGPFLHPGNGRLYWCHGRKGHKVTGKDGKQVHEGMACGIWNCQPDGSDVQWHSLGCGDNPVEVDFTPSGDVIGVQNLYYTNPRGDTLVHWLYGGVYERGDQLKAIQGLPRTLATMPVIYNFGHVAVSGSCFWSSYPGGEKSGNLQYMVTHFNTQRVVRMELTPSGSTYQATENEFLKLNSPDIHLTDVMEDKDGSLLVIDTGGWFRIGCPASLMAKPDIAGAIYRVKPKTSRSVVKSSQTPLAPIQPAETEEAILSGLASGNPSDQRRACDAIARLHNQPPALRKALLALLAKDIDPALEHAAMNAGMAMRMSSDEVAASQGNALLLRRMLQIWDRQPSEVTTPDGHNDITHALKHLDAEDRALSKVALAIVSRHPKADAKVADLLARWLAQPAVTLRQLQVIEGLCGALVGNPQTNEIIGKMLGHAQNTVNNAALRVLANQTTAKLDDQWLAPLDRMLNQQASSTLLDAIKKLKNSKFDGTLAAIANNDKQPQSLRLKALDAMSNRKLTDDTFAMLKAVLTEPTSSSAAKILAAGMLAHSGLTSAQLVLVTPVLEAVGPVELKELLLLIRNSKDVVMARTLATSLARNPSLISQQESVYRTALSSHPPEIFETTVFPAYKKAMEAVDARKRELAPLAEKVIAKGDVAAGRAVFESGRGTCIACHQVGDKGRNIGPNLTHIGAIRTERDLLESILFPSNTLARDYEAHIFETTGGETITGVIRSHTAEGLLVVDIAGQEKTIAHANLVSDTELTTSLMPLGLDQTVPEQDLINLVAWLRSLK